MFDFIFFLGILWLSGCGIIAVRFFYVQMRIIRQNRRVNYAYRRRPIKDYPSVSVCIPARNEMHALAPCLEAVLASKYPKLEIIVLDDESSDQTKEIIRSFAHAGVRFIEGETLPEGWSGKSFALYNLAKNALGKEILFVDVDTHIQPDTIEKMVAYKENYSTKMISVIPSPRQPWIRGLLFAPLRYYWLEILNSRFKPSSTGAIWMISASELLDGSALQNYKSAISPDGRFARTLAKVKGGYTFLIHGQALGISFQKRWHSQIETEKRILISIFGGRLKGVLLSFLATFFYFLPIPMILMAVIYGFSYIIWLNCLAILGLTYTLHVIRQFGGAGILAIFTVPYVFVQEFYIWVASLASYLKGSVTWKGRTVYVRKSIKDRSIQ